MPAPKVQTKHKDYDRLLPQWERCRDAAAGTDAVKAKRTAYLPRLDSHVAKPKKYDEYLMRALYYNAVGRTIQGMAGAVFQKEPTVHVDTIIETHAKDITLTGEPLEQFGLDTMKECMTTGRYGILVDMQKEESTDPRPYWVGYKAEDIVNWRYKRIDGDQTLVLVVLREVDEQQDPKDEFVVKCEDRYRVLRLKDDTTYTQQVYTKKAGAKDFTADDDGEVTPTRKGAPLPFIPFALPWALTAPPLLDLVDVALSHFRASADLKHGLHFTALPTPYVTGQTADGKPLSIGSGVAWSLAQGAQAGMLEFTGAGLASIAADMQVMQNMMATLGARLIDDSAVRNETELTAQLRVAGDHASLRLITQLVEQMLNWCLQVHTWWLLGANDQKVEDIEATIALNKDFFAVMATPEEVKTLVLMLQAETISYETFYHRLMQGGWTREGITADEEQEEIATQVITKPITPGKPGQPVATHDAEGNPAPPDQATHDALGNPIPAPPPPPPTKALVKPGTKPETKPAKQE